MKSHTAIALLSAAGLSVCLSACCQNRDGATSTSRADDREPYRSDWNQGSVNDDRARTTYRNTEVDFNPPVAAPRGTGSPYVSAGEPYRVHGRDYFGDQAPRTISANPARPYDPPQARVRINDIHD